MKSVKVINTKTGTPVVVETDATQLGQLQDQLSRMNQFSGIDWKSSVIFQRDSTGRSTKSLRDEAISNESSFTLFISPSKHKGGQLSPSVIRDTRAKINAILDELLGEEAGTSVKKEAISLKLIYRSDFDALVDIVHANNLDIDISNYDEDDSTSVEDMRDDIADELGLSNSPKKPSLTSQEERDLRDLA